MDIYTKAEALRLQFESEKSKYLRHIQQIINDAKSSWQQQLLQFQGELQQRNCNVSNN